MSSLNWAWSCSSALGHAVSAASSAARDSAAGSPGSTEHEHPAVELIGDVLLERVEADDPARLAADGVAVEHGLHGQRHGPGRRRTGTARGRRSDSPSSSALSAVTATASPCTDGDRATRDLEVVELVDHGRVDRHHVGGRPVDLGRRRAHGRHQVDAGDGLAGRPRRWWRSPGSTSRTRRRSRPGTSRSTADCDRVLRRRGEDRDEPDQGDADHQRRRGGRRALGVAAGVLAGVRAGDAEQPRRHAEQPRRPGRPAPGRA